MVASAVVALVERVILPWEGSATELLAELDREVKEPVRALKTWPKMPSQLSGRLRRAASNLRKIAETMSRFRADYGSDFWSHIPDHSNRSRETRKAWSDKVSAWLFSTDHIEITYGLQYEGIDIQQLSPGTLGIVLLLIYLSIDQEDVRPLILDQPEENLDPKSIYDDLVERFREAKTRRQIIIVTHNANLVVNTDADQVIVASRGEQRQGQLPILTYHSGGLENPDIRKSVCEILEGGE